MSDREGKEKEEIVIFEDNVQNITYDSKKGKVFKAFEKLLPETVDVSTFLH